MEAPAVRSAQRPVRDMGPAPDTGSGGTASPRAFDRTARDVVARTSACSPCTAGRDQADVNPLELMHRTPMRVRSGTADIAAPGRSSQEDELVAADFGDRRPSRCVLVGLKAHACSLHRLNPPDCVVGVSDGGTRAVLDTQFHV